MAGTVHLIYPHGDRISCPDAIGRNLAARLAADFNVVTHDWDEQTVIVPQPGDLLIGHPHPSSRTIFRQSLQQPGWKRIVMLCPYAHGDLRQVAMWDTVIARCDEHLAITGNYWMRTMPESAFAHWAPKTTQLDLAVDRRDFPVSKTVFNPPGRRRFLYIGSDVWVKNTPYLEAIARRLPGTDFSWIGSARRPLEGFRALGPQDFSQPESRRLVAGHDFIITAGFSDANPTVILEAMAWGLIPVCTPQSGYEGIRSVVNIPLGDADGAAAILRAWQEKPEAELLAIQQENFRQLDSHFDWDRFAAQVKAALLATGSPPLGAIPAGRRLRIRWAAMRSPYAPWHPIAIARRLRNRWRNRTGRGGK